jgi:hypothetical protein
MAARVVAFSGHHRVSLKWDGQLNTEENHRAAAIALATERKWDGVWHGGSMKDGYCFVFVLAGPHELDRFTIDKPMSVDCDLASEQALDAFEKG